MWYFSDSVPHVPDSDLNQTEVLQLIKNITDFLTMTFPNVPVYPLLGNHDISPANQQPGRADSYYVDIIEKTGWQRFLTTSQLNSFKQGSFVVLL